MSKSTPKPPDYEAAANRQAESSKEVTEQQTWANRPNQYTPFGKQEWVNTPTRDPVTGQTLNRWSQTTTLDPRAQAALDSQMRLQQDRSQLGESMTGRMRDEYGTAMDWGGFDPLAKTPQGAKLTPEQLQRTLSTQGLTNLDPSQKYRQDANDAIYNQWASRALPDQERATNQLRTQLYNQGLTEGSEAYDNEMRKLRESQGDAQRQAQYQATIGSGEEAQRMLGMDSATRAQMFGERGTTGAFANQAAGQAFGMAGEAGAQNYGQQMQSANYQNQLRQQQIAEQMQRRGATLNEINAILHGQQVGMPDMPGFNTAERSQGVQSLQAADSQWGADMDKFNMDQAAKQSTMSGLGSLAGGFMSFSDRRLKRNIVRRGSLSGISFYSYDYLWGQHGFGVMADEVLHIPGAVHIHPSGYQMVDYGVIYGR